MMNLTSNRIRLRHLRCFVAMSEFADVSKAANVLRTTQAVVSRSLRELEIEVGKSLFARTADGLQLTPAGVSYRHHIAANSPARDGAVRRSAAVLPIGMLSGVANTLAPRATALFRQSQPAVNVQMICADAHQLIDALRIGKIDMIIGRKVAMAQNPDLQFEPLFSETLVFVAPRDHPLATATSVGLSQINCGLVLVPAANTMARRGLDKFLQAHAKSAFRETIETSSAEFVRSYLAVEQAVACAPLGALQAELASGALVQLPLSGADLVSTVGITTLTEKPLPAVPERFANAVRTVAAQQ